MRGATAAARWVSAATERLIHTSSIPASAAAVGATTTSLTHHPGFVELRSYALNPSGMVNFLKTAKENADLRKSMLPLQGMFSVDTGDFGNGASLNTIIHMYSYDNFDHRDRVRRAAANNPAWKKYIADSRDFVARQESAIYLPACGVLDAVGAVPLPEQAANSLQPSADQGPAVYELRQTQLLPGYGSVPTLLKAFEKGLPAKVAADTEGRLVFFGYTDVGILNNVIELWRYSSAQACIEARQKARQVPEWREAIGVITPGVGSFKTAFLNPLSFSPLQ